MHKDRIYGRLGRDYHDLFETPEWQEMQERTMRIVLRRHEISGSDYQDWLKYMGYVA